MRKALIGLILAASAMTPAAAQAQMVEREEPMLERYRQQGERNRARAEARQQRQEARQEARQQARQSREARQERREARQERRQQAAPAPVVRQAQRDERRRGDRGDRQRRESVIDRAWQGDRNDPRMEEHRRRYQRLERENQREYQRERREDRRDWNRDRRDDRRDWRRDRRDDRRDWRDDRRDRRHWNRDWRRDRRYDWQRWRWSNRSLYRLPRYYAPYRDHRYSRFSIGIHLGQPFYSQRYWISDPWRYRLPPAPHGYQWVRYYDDVLLVDTWTGEVVDVIYDFFW